MAAEQEHEDQLPLIIEYLESHPDIFLDNPQLLSKLNIPHITGKRVHSLIEYQVQRLRQHQREHLKEIQKLKEYQSYCDELGVNAYDIALKLQDSKSLESLYDQLFLFLKNEYACSELLIYLFVEDRPRGDYRGLCYKPKNSRIRDLFSGLFTLNRPLCDSLQTEYLDLLFGTMSLKIKSTVALPIQHDDCFGIMVLGSMQYDAYSHGFSIHLLNYLKEIFLKCDNALRDNISYN